MDAHSSKAKRDSSTSPTNGYQRKLGDDHPNQQHLRHPFSMRVSPQRRDSAKSRDHRGGPDTDLRDHDRDRDRDHERDRGRERDRDRSTASSSTRDRDRDDDAATSDASNAETVVLPGRDGYSPSKARKVRHEREKDDDIASDSLAPAILPPLKLPNKTPALSLSSTTTKPAPTPVGSATTGTASALASEPSRILYGVLAHKKPVKRVEKPPNQRPNGTVPSAAPQSTSPPPTKRRSQSSAAASGPTAHATSDSESEIVSKPAAKDKAAKTSAASTDKAGSEKMALHKRKLIKTESDDEAEVSRKVRRPRILDHGPSATSRSSKDGTLKSHKHELSNLNASATGRSISPLPKPLSHRRSASTNGIALNKKRKTPTPIHAFEYNSDESSASGSPYPGRNSAAIPRGVAERVDSPAGKGPSKKHLDAHGQTLLARACAKGEYEIAKQRLAERPEDLNVADYAGNTPLQIAALHGSEEIVDLLLRAGCNKHCINYDKETPLLDAVDNGHVGVVRLLLQAGVNPRKANCNGEEPLARVDSDSETGPEIRALLEKARAEFRHPTEGPREAEETADTSEENNHHSTEHDHSRNSRAPDSPSSAALFGSVPSHRRAGTARATKTSNHLLYMNMDDKTLRSACGRGDYETVTHLLEVRLDFNYPEAMTAAARGGHEVVMELLLALGGADPDPAPIKTGSSDTATPILAAIGQENIKVLKLLLDQSSFDPTRRFKGMTYYELARERNGVNCKEEEELLKKAYDEYRRRNPEKAKNADREHTSWLLEQDSGRRDRDNREKDQASPAADRDTAHSTSTKSSQAKRATSPSSRDTDMLKKKGVSKPTASGSVSKEQESKDKEHREPKKLSELKEKKRASSADFSDDPSSSKRGSLLSNATAAATKTKKKDKERDTDNAKPTVGTSDREMSPVMQKKKTKRTVEADAAASSEGEAVKPRRKLMSKGELTAEHEKQRRASMASNASSSLPPNQPSSPRERDDYVPIRNSKGDVPSEKYHNRTKAIKRDEVSSADAAQLSKRHRTSTSPPPRRSGMDKEDQEPPNTKRRRVEAEMAKEQRRKKLEKAEAGNGSADDGHEPRLPKTGILSRDPPTAKAAKVLKETRERDATATRDLSKGTLKDALKAKKLSAAKHDRSQSRASLSAVDSDVEMKDPLAADPHRARKDQESKADASEKKRRPESEDLKAKRDSQEEKKRLEERRVKAQEKRRVEEEAAAEAEIAAEAAAKKRIAEEEREAERRRREQEAEEARLAREAKERKEAEKKRLEEEARIRRERELEQQRLAEEQRKKAEEEKRLAEEARLKEEEERKRKEDEEKREKERLYRLEEERRLREEEELKRKKEEEASLKAEEEHQKQLEEERRRAREESERLQREQLEREAREADQARRRREEERLATKIAEQRRIQAEQEETRLAGLPAVLRWFEACPNPRQAFIAQKFFHMQGVRWDTLDTSYDGTPEGREQWVLNVQAALLLGEKDLTLSRYTDWKRIPATRIAKTMIWRVENDRYALTSPRYYDIGRALPSYYGEPNDPDRMTQKTMERLRKDAMTRFFEMDMFFVKLSDLMYIVPTMPHLRDMKLAVEYRELPDREELLYAFFWSGQKWRKDPDVEKYMGFAPKRRYFINGEYVREVLPSLSKVSRTPFPETNRVPRRFGLTQVHPHEADYVELCKKQGLEHLIPLATGAALANADGELPAVTGSSTTMGSGSGTSDTSSDSPTTANGHSS